MCFNCEKKGHTAVGCRALSHCPVCAATGLPAGYKAGKKGCVPYDIPMRMTALAEITGKNDKGVDRGEPSAATPVLGGVTPAEEGMVSDPFNN